jgi:hypothetical protein
VSRTPASGICTRIDLRNSMNRNLWERIIDSRHD